MKCIRNMETGEIKRVTDEHAISKVATGKFSYCPKADWKYQKDALANLQGNPNLPSWAIGEGDQQ